MEGGKMRQKLAKKIKKLERSCQIWQELNDGNLKVCKSSINDVKKW